MARTTFYILHRQSHLIPITAFHIFPDEKLRFMPTVQSQENTKSTFELRSLITQLMLFPLHCRISFICSTSPQSIGHTKNGTRKMKDMKTMAFFKNKHLPGIY